VAVVKMGGSAPTIEGVEGHASISPEVLGRYAADAARDVHGVRGLPRRVKLEDEDGRLAVELHVAVEWGASIPHVGREVQQRVREYLKRMADVETSTVDVLVDEVGPARE
jgi:uncharacterized alkaline shock family protein YloU